MATNQTQARGLWEFLLDPFILPLARALDSRKAQLARAKRSLLLQSTAESQGLEYCREYGVSDYLVRFNTLLDCLSVVIVRENMPIAYCKVPIPMDEYRCACGLVRELRQNRVRRV